MYQADKLTTADCASTRLLILDSESHPALQPSGISFCPVEHQGCTQRSFEEAKVVSTLVLNLVKQRFCDEHGIIRPLALEDILAVSPFNMQVSALRRALPERTRVGTVDKFQGQEAPAVIISMATSHGEDAPPDTEHSMTSGVLQWTSRFLTWILEGRFDDILGERNSVAW